MTTEKKKTVKKEVAVEAPKEAAIDTAVEEAKKVAEDKALAIAAEKAVNDATAKKVQEMFSDNESVTLAEAALQNNEILFEVEGKSYRVRQSNFQEKQDANKKRMKLYVELLKDKDCLLEKDLRSLYKERGMDVEGIDKQILELTNQQQKLLFDLGKAIKENKDKVELDKYKEEITLLMQSIQGLSMEKQRLLEFSLENRVMMDVYSWLIWTVSEVKVGETWQRVWSSYDEFIQSTPSELLTTITKNATILITEDLNANMAAIQ